MQVKTVACSCLNVATALTESDESTEELDAAEEATDEAEVHAERLRQG